VGVAEEFYFVPGIGDQPQIGTLGTAAVNLHMEGQRPGAGDIVVVPAGAQ